MNIACMHELLLSSVHMETECAQQYFFLSTNNSKIKCIMMQGRGKIPVHKICTQLQLIEINQICCIINNHTTTTENNKLILTIECDAHCCRYRLLVAAYLIQAIDKEEWTNNDPKSCIRWGAFFCFEFLQNIFTTNRCHVCGVRKSIFIIVVVTFSILNDSYQHCEILVGNIVKEIFAAQNTESIYNRLEMSRKANGKF